MRVYSSSSPPFLPTVRRVTSNPCLHLEFWVNPFSQDLAAHLAQTFFASLWAGGLLVVVNLAIVLLGGYQGVHTWVVLILYFTVCHSTLVLLGVIGLTKAMAAQCWRYPLIGRPLPTDCPGRRP